MITGIWRLVQRNVAGGITAAVTDAVGRAGDDAVRCDVRPDARGQTDRISACLDI